MLYCVPCRSAGCRAWVLAHAVQGTLRPENISGRTLLEYLEEQATHHERALPRRVGRVLQCAREWVAARGRVGLLRRSAKCYRRRRVGETGGRSVGRTRCRVPALVRPQRIALSRAGTRVCALVPRPHLGAVVTLSRRGKFIWAAVRSNGWYSVAAKRRTR